MTSLPFLDILAESIVVDRRGRSPSWLQEAAVSFRRQALMLLGNPARHELATLLLWEAEAYEDEDVAILFERALPRHKLIQLLAGADPATHHPHRLLVTGVDGFTCGACGDDFGAVTAVVVDGADDLTYCSACIGMASRAIGNGEFCPDDIEPVKPGAVVSSEVPVTAWQRGPSPAALRLPRMSRLRAQAAALVLAGTVTGSAGLASAGVLPGPLQRAVHQTLALVGISVPESSSASEAGTGSDAGSGSDEQKPDLTAETTKTAPRPASSDDHPDGGAPGGRHTDPTGADGSAGTEATIASGWDNGAETGSGEAPEPSAARSDMPPGGSPQAAPSSDPAGGVSRTDATDTAATDAGAATAGRPTPAPENDSTTTTSTTTTSTASPSMVPTEEPPPAEGGDKISPSGTGVAAVPSVDDRRRGRSGWSHPAGDDRPLPFQAP